MKNIVMLFLVVGFFGGSAAQAEEPWYEHLPAGQDYCLRKIQISKGPRIGGYADCGPGATMEVTRGGVDKCVRKLLGKKVSSFPVFCKNPVDSLQIK